MLFQSCFSKQETVSVPTSVPETQFRRFWFLFRSVAGKTALTVPVPLLISFWIDGSEVPVSASGSHDEWHHTDQFIYFGS